MLYDLLQSIIRKIFRLAMTCLEQIRENFIEMDMTLGLMEEAYGTFSKYQIQVPKEDIERVDTLRYNFDNMITHVSIFLIISYTLNTCTYVLLGKTSSRAHM